MEGFFGTGSAVFATGVCLALTVYLGADRISRRSLPAAAYLSYTWLFFLAFVISEAYSFRSAVWILAVVCFLALREYFTLVDIRLQDRLGVFGAYLSIPFMTYFIQDEWYGMFIISIPVYAFLAIPLLVTLGGCERRGTVFSIGAVNFGLFLFVYCLGHIGYLMTYAPSMAAMLVLCVAACDLISTVVQGRMQAGFAALIARLLIPIPLTVGIGLLMSAWTGIAAGHCVALGALIAPLVVMGHHTIDYVKADLGVRREGPLPGQGRILDNLQSLFFVAPVVFHYIRYFLI